MSYADRTKRPPRTLTDREVKRILEVTGKAAAGFRDHVIISLALGCGLRESEIVALDVLDVAKDTAKGITPKRTIQLRVFKRGGRHEGAAPEFQRVHLPDATFYKLDKYLQAKWGTQRPAPTVPLFTSRLGRRLSQRMVRKLWRVWQQRAGFDVLYNFHTLRHTAITSVRRKTKDIRIAQRFARHVNIATTVRYEHASDEEVAAATKDLIA